MEEKPELDRNKNYWLSAKNDPKLTESRLTFWETLPEYAQRVARLRECGYYLEDRMVTVYDRPDGKVLGKMWMSELVADYHNK